MPRKGRPLTGVRAATRFYKERVSLFVKLTGRYPPQVAAELRELASLQGEPLWLVLLDAAERHVKAQAPKLRGKLARRARRSRRELQRDAAEHYERNLELKAKARHATE